MNQPYVDDVIRTFYALTVPPPLVDAVRRIQGRARIDLPRGLRWTRPEQTHMTLAFLGDVPVDALPDLKSILEQVAADSPAFDVEVQGIGGFPRAERPRVVWAGVAGDATSRFAEMHERLWASLEAIKPKPAERPFHPHLTLARIAGPQPPRVAEWMLKHADWKFGPWPVRELHLIQSVLTPKGPLYETLGKVELK